MRHFIVFGVLYKQIDSLGSTLAIGRLPINDYCHNSGSVELVARVTIDIVGRVAGQPTRPSPQAQFYLLESCPVSK